MIKPDQSLSDIRSTGEEAERWLEALESDYLPSISDTEPVSNNDTTTQTLITRNEAHPALLILILVILLSPLILLAVYLNVGSGSPSNSTTTTTTIPYAASCGSTASASGRWWPVLGGGDRSLLRTVRNRYCGDAFINATGALQVASFGSLEEAEAFKARIEEATGESSFRVGKGIVPGG